MEASMSQLPTSGGVPTGPFDQIKRLNPYGIEYWSARELMHLLDYDQWRNFSHAIEKAKTSCRESGNESANHFADDSKMVDTGSSARRNIKDVHLSRFACYLIAQNGNPSKPAIANAQKYFAIQARRQELSDELLADRERIELRDQCTREFKNLSGVARQVGVNDRHFGIFHDAGYKGLYGGLGIDDIKARKNIPAKDNLMDRIGSTELAANSFKLTQARDRLQAMNITSEQHAFKIHRQVGEEVRDAISALVVRRQKTCHPKSISRKRKMRIKKAKPKIQLEGPVATGLLPDSADDFSDL